MVKLQYSSVFLVLCLLWSLQSCNTLELKPRPSKIIDRMPSTQDGENRPLDKATYVEAMSIVDTFAGNRGKGSSTGGLLYRRGQVFYTAARVFADYKYVQWRCNQMQNADEAVITDIWNKAHERNAEFLGSKFISLEGLWVKLGQYLSSRADVMPDPYLRVLSKCQDSLPAKPFGVIKAQVEFELGKPLQSVFSHVDEIPLACASIAQVHRAKLISGRDVVIKVQHAEVAERLLQDLRNLETIGNTIKRFEPDFDFSPVIREWASEIPKELDFRSEASNMQKVESNLSPMLPHTSIPSGLDDVSGLTEREREGDSLGDLTIDVSLPQVIVEYVTEKMLVMSYIDGFKVDNKVLLDEFSADKNSIVKNITRAFAHQIFVDGFYTADPHPGNLLVDKVTLKPVLLDFGLTKQVTPEARFYFSKLLVSAAEQDIVGLLDALDGVGLKLRPDVPFDAQLLAKYFFRDANKQAESRVESQQRREEYKKKQELAKASQKVMYTGDMVDVTESEGIYQLLGMKSSRKGKVLSVSTVRNIVADAMTKDSTASSDQSSTSTVNVLFTNGEEKEVQLSAVAVQTGRSPIDAWPDAFIFFDRVLGLLRGLTASLDVSQSYLEVMTPYARKALRDRYAQQQRDSPTKSIIPDITKDVRGLDKLGGVAQLVQQLIDSGDILGCQVCVLENDVPILDISAGKQSPYDGTPVAPDTIFNCFSVTKGVAAGAVHMLAERGLVDLHSPMSKYWPAFAANGKEAITVAQVLNHQAGLANAGLEEISRDPYIVCDTDLMLSIVANSTPEHAPGLSTKYHYLTFGWLVEGLVKSVTGDSLRNFVNANIGTQLDIDKEFMIGIPGDADADGEIGEASRKSSERREEEETLGRVANLVLGRIVMPPAPPKSTSVSPVKIDDTHPSTPTPEPAPVAAVAVVASTTSPTVDALSVSQATTTETQPVKVTSFKQRPPSGPSLLMNPTFFNNPRIRQASVPSANGHFSARALAKYYSSVKIHTPSSAKSSDTSPSGLSGEAMLQGGAGSFSNGFQLFPSVEPAPGSPITIETKGMSFGHGGLGGSVAFCRPDSKKKLAVAITLNRLSFDNSKTTGEIVRAIFDKLKVPVPLAYAKKVVPSSPMNSVR